MNYEDEILAKFDEYFENASDEEIKKDVEKINRLGFKGISLENYFKSLNQSTSFIFQEIGFCDDIAYAEFFKKTMLLIDMGAQSPVLQEVIKLPSDSSYKVGANMPNEVFNLAA